MSINNEASISTNGLVFYYDSDNLKSYVGRPCTNLISYITPAGSFVANGTSGIPVFSLTSGTEKQYVPQLGMLDVPYTRIMNDYNGTYGGGSSGNCCPSPFSFGNMYVSGSTLYTYAIVYRSSNNYTNTNFMYRYEYSASGGYVTESGVFNTSNRIHLGDNWYWAWGTFTTNANTASIGYAGLYYYLYYNATKIQVAKAMMIAGDHTALHPKYWPSLGTTRSNTQCLLDLTKNNTITANSLTYSTNGSFSFNGSTDNMHPSINHSYLNNSALEVIFKTNEITAVDRMIFGYKHNIGYSYPTIGSIFFNNNDLKASVITTSQTYRTVTVTGCIQANQYYHVILNKNVSAGTLELYINGSLSATQTFDSATYAQWPTQGTYIGENILDIGHSSNVSVSQGWTTSYLKGNIPIAKVYNRVLNTHEIKQNFNAIRGRYGL